MGNAYCVLRTAYCVTSLGFSVAERGLFVVVTTQPIPVDDSPGGLLGLFEAIELGIFIPREPWVEQLLVLD